VDPDDLGKVIGRGGRVAQALRTIVRAGAEGRVTVDIVDAEDDDEEDEVEAHAGEPLASADLNETLARPVTGESPEPPHGEAP
jgi:hypothetical protein